MYSGNRQQLISRMWDEKRFVGEEAQAAERRVAPLAPEALDVAAHDAGAGHHSVNLSLEIRTRGGREEREGVH